MINPGYWHCEDPQGQIKCTALIQSLQFKGDDGIRRNKTGIPLDVEMDDFSLDVDSSDMLLQTYSKQKTKIILLECNVIVPKYDLMGFISVQSNFGKLKLK